MLSVVMQVEALPDPCGVAAAAADAICAAVGALAHARIGLPTGDTPILTFEELKRREAAGTADFSGVTVYAIDEFAGVARAARGTNSAFYRDHLTIRIRALACPDAAAEDPEAEIGALAASIQQEGGLDLCVLGVGTNGHLAFNEPGSGRDSRARIVMLDEPSRRAHAAAFGGLERVPARGMTLGVGDLLEARRILVLAQGGAKAKVVRAAIEGPQSASVPASWLRSHAGVTWLLDEAAASLLSRPPGG